MNARHRVSRGLRGKLPGASSVSAALVLLAHVCPAQEGLQTAVEEDRGYRTRRAPLQRPEDYHSIGNLTYFTSLNYALEYRDNVFSSENNERSDFIHRPYLDLRALWKVTRDSTVQFGAGLGYTKYTRFTDQDRLSIAPNTTIAWDLPVKDFIFTVYDRVSYSEDVLSQSAISGVVSFPRLDNTLGIRATWNPGRYQLQTGFSHQNFHSSSAQFNYVNRATESVFLRGAYRFQPNTLAGLEGTAAFTSYSSKIQSDNQNLSAGPYVEWQVTRSLELSARGGVVQYSFDPSLSNPGPISDLSSFYVGAEARHDLTRHIHHGLTVDRRVQQGLNQGGRYIASTEFVYNVLWQANRRLNFTLDARFEDGKESLATGDEDYDRLGGGLGVSYRITRHITPLLRYSYIQRNSSVAGRGYDVNSVTLSMSYRF